MCDDPSNLTPDARERIEKYADKESREMGFDNWIDAYHWTPGSEANVQEHATPLARAHAEHGVEVQDTGEVENRAASGGCGASPCSAFVILGVTASAVHKK